MMIHDPSDIDSDVAAAAINKSDLIVKKDLRSNGKSSEVSTLNLEANNLSPKRQSDSQSNGPVTRSEANSRASKRLRETNLVNKSSKIDTEDEQSKSYLTEDYPRENKEASAGTLCNSIESSKTGGKSVDHNAGCDIKGKKNFVNSEQACGSDRAGLHATPEASSIKNNKMTKVQPAIQRPPTNLIRREDSWQSLVSLTRVGKVGPASMQGK